MRCIFNYIADSLAWKIDDEQTRKSRNKSPYNISFPTENIYMVNKRTGDRKIEIGRYSVTPPDMEWLAQTKNTGTIIDPFSGPKTYTREELQEHIEKCKALKDQNNTPPPAP